jgi:hypothetical protein
MFLKKVTALGSGSRAMFLMLGIVGHGGCGNGVGTTADPTMSYVLVAPIKSNNTYLMDLNGQLVHEWKGSNIPGLSVYLLPDGHLLRANSLGQGAFPGGGGNGGRITEYDWDGNVVWSFDYNSPTYQQHHDVKKMPNGHVLMVAWEMRSGEEAIAAGRDPATIPANDQLWPDMVVEVDPSTSQVVWQWRVWDHLLPPGADPLEHPELIDPNTHAVASVSDWTHVNAVDYNPSLDQVMISTRNLSEIFVIDHSTTTEQASGHTGGKLGRGGDLVYRWGNPGNYGESAPQQLFGQHNAHWIEDGLSGAGQILVFDNGDKTLRPYTTAVQIAPEVGPDGAYVRDPVLESFDPTAPDWQYEANPPESLFAPIISSAQRLENGDTLLCDGTTGHIFEVTPTGDTVWTYNLVDTNGKTGVQAFRATRYEGTYSGLAGRNLAPQGPLQVELIPQ